jgi:tRNA pseudouridine55 synthase
MTPGIHLIHKPVGPTSFARMRAYVEGNPVAAGKRELKVCHGGTLDPFASGLLLILVGPATRLFEHLHAIPKVYEATVRWGVETDNGDPLGRPTFTGDASALTPQQLDDALATFVGWHEQTPPATSAKRIDGERAYLKAHRGETVEMPSCRVYLHEAIWLSHDLPRESRLRMVVRGGYYIRALARDLGRRLRCGAHLTALHRTAIGPWLDPGPSATPGADRGVEVTGHGLLPWVSSRVLSDHEIGELRAGRTIPVGGLLPPEWSLPAGFPEPAAPVRGFHRDRLCFLLEPQDGQLRLLSALRGL